MCRSLGAVLLVSVALALTACASYEKLNRQRQVASVVSFF